MAIDLTVSNITWDPPNPTEGQVVTFTATVSNIGSTTLASGNPLVVAFHISDNGGAFTGILPTVTPSDPNLIAVGKTILASIKGIEGSYRLIGVGDYNWTIENIDDRSNLVFSVTGKYPIVRGFDLDPWRYPRPDDLPIIAASWTDNKAIPYFTMHCAPWGGSDMWETLDDTVDIATYLTPSTPENDQLMAMLDNIAEDIQVLETAGVPILWRGYHEAGGGMWWCNNGSSAYVQLWQHMWNYFTNTKGLHNIIWFWSTIGTDGQSMTAYYPGDAYVDVMGGSCYNDGRTPAGNWSVLNACSTSKPKLITECYCCDETRYHIWPYDVNYPYAFIHTWDPVRPEEYADFSAVYNAPQAITRDYATQFVNGLFVGTNYTGGITNGGSADIEGAFTWTAGDPAHTWQVRAVVDPKSFYSPSDERTETVTLDSQTAATRVSLAMWFKS